MWCFLSRHKNKQIVPTTLNPHPLEAVIIPITREQLSEIISAAVEEGVQRALSLRSEAAASGDEDLLDAGQAASLLRLTIRSVYNKTSQRELPFMKRGRKIYFSRRELLDWMSEGRCRTRTESLSLAESHLRRLTSSSR